MSYQDGGDAPSERPRLKLAPRSGNAPAAGAPATKSSIFGAARPREAIIAEREGKAEEDIIKEAAKKEWKPTLVLSEEQKEEKKALEAELAYAKDQLEKAVDPLKAKDLKEEVAEKESKLEDLLASFEKLAVSAAQSGGVGKRPSERKRDAEERAGGGQAGYGGGAGGYGGGGRGGGGESYGNFSQGRDREPYGDAWAGKSGGGGRGGSTCYNCGEVGHISRECPNPPSEGSRGYGGGGGRSGGGGRACYNCGEEGHISRECPQPRSGGGGGYGGGGYGGGGSYGGSYGGSRGGAESYGDRYGSGGGGYGGGGGGYGGGGGSYGGGYSDGNSRY